MLSIDSEQSEISHSVQIASQPLMNQLETPPSAARSSYRIIVVLCAVFFASGFSAIVYQLVWQRSLFSIYGVNIESITVVVAAFMLGLGIGSLVGGRISKSDSIPLLLLFGIIELSIGFFGIVSLDLIQWIGENTHGATPIVTGFITFTEVLIPTILMGATFPILVKFVVRNLNNVGQSVGILYFVNTIGSAFGCAAIVGFMMRTMGMEFSVMVASGINIAVGISAIVLSSFLKAPVAEQNRDSDRVREPAKQAPASGPEFNPIPFGYGLLIAGVVGAISLSYEILWARIFSFTLQGRGFAFALLLGAFLAGIAVGSLGASYISQRLRTRKDFIQFVSVMIVLSNGLGFLLAPVAAEISRYIPSMASTFLFLGLFFATAVVLGSIFPILVHISIHPQDDVGSRVSYVYLANIIGSTAGSLVTGFVLLEYIGYATVSATLAGIGFFAGLILLYTATEGPKSRAMITTCGIGLMLALTFGTPFLYDGLFEKLLSKEEFVPADRFTSVVENRAGIISVTDDGTVFGSGVYDGKFNTSLKHDTNGINRPYFLAALHPKPERILMIGLSTGSWAQVIAHHPDVKELVVIEINEGYLALVDQSAVVKSLLVNPRVKITIDDGRRWLASHPDEKFDAVVMNTTWHWRAFASNLLSEEFLTAVGSHLKPGGIAWYNATLSSSAERTGMSVFPYGYKIGNNVVGSYDPISIDADRLRKVITAYSIDGKALFDISSSRDIRVVEGLVALADTSDSGPGWIESRQNTLMRTAIDPIITDDNMGAEWFLRGSW
jgi:spermidine synthase